MLNRLYLPVLAVLSVLAVALAAVWPQGMGDRSPPPFGHAPTLRSAQMQAAILRESEASERRLNRAREAVRDLHDQAVQRAQ